MCSGEGNEMRFYGCHVFLFRCNRVVRNVKNKHKRVCVRLASVAQSVGVKELRAWLSRLIHQKLRFSDVFYFLYFFFFISKM